MNEKLREKQTGEINSSLKILNITYLIRKLPEMFPTRGEYFLSLRGDEKMEMRKKVEREKRVREERR